MQVAATSGSNTGVLNDAREATKAAMKEMVARIKEGSEPTGYQPSHQAKFAIQYIADSTRLTGAEKKSLMSLLAMADQYAGTKPEVVEAIMALAKVMEMNREEGSYKSHSYKKMLEEYQKERAKFDPKTYETKAMDVASVVAEMRAKAEAKLETVSIATRQPAPLEAALRFPTVDITA